MTRKDLQDEFNSKTIDKIDSKGIPIECKKYIEFLENKIVRYYNRFRFINIPKKEKPNNEYQS